MANRAIEMLKESRLAKVISDIEAGEQVDYGRVATLQAFDTARAGEVFLAERLKMEDEANRQMEEILNE
ncbi:hypothetical protein LCGC14_1557520 [marine sediment metagenome]|uniref:Uncharacterized protein n=1 Tax=marine sediment metagenome TaxID=412755 RepID=A0A0F9L4T2_9ZZZZ